MRTVGERIGGEARRKGAHVLLAPTVNIHRHPLAGRNFECYSEDPFLSARLAVSYINGVQSTGVGCSVKHFVANDSEFERQTISSEVDARTLREISLVPFEAAVLEAGTWSVMSAYNRLHGTYCSEHPLLTELLKREWGFDGVIMSDWYGTHSTVPAANAGLDLEMPGPPQFFGPHLAAAVRAGEVDEKIVDDKVRRVLRAARSRGRSRPCPIRARSSRSTTPKTAPSRAAPQPRASCSCATRDGALPIEAADRSGALPLLAVIGPNAGVAMIQGGGSARVSPFTPVTPLAGLRERFGDTFRVEHERGLLELQADAGARHDRARRPAARRLLRGSRARGRARARRARRPRPGSRSPVRSRPRCPAEFSMRDLGNGGRARERRAGRSASCRSAGPG